MSFRRLTWRELLLACTAIVILAPAAMAGGVRDPVPTRTAPPPNLPIGVISTPYQVNSVIISYPWVNCSGITLGGVVSINVITGASAPVNLTANGRNR